MNAGKLNRRITIQKKIITYDSYNQPVETWEDAFTVWAEVLTTGGGEFYAAQKVNAQTQVVFNIRFTKGVSVTDRVKFEGRIFEILSVNDLNAGRVKLQISAKEVV